MGERACSVLFLGTGNATRSIMAEALLRHHAGDRFVVHSAGTRPTWRISRTVLAALARHGIVDPTLRSKSWAEFRDGAAVSLDIVLWVCVPAAHDVQPAWPGNPVIADWTMPDPAAADGGELERRSAFSGALRVLESRVQLLEGIPVAELDREELHARLQEIARDPRAAR